MDKFATRRISEDPLQQQTPYFKRPEQHVETGHAHSGHVHTGHVHSGHAQPKFEKDLVSQVRKMRPEQTNRGFQPVRRELGGQLSLIKERRESKLHEK